MVNPTYVTREDLMAAADVQSSAVIGSQLDRILYGASRAIDLAMRRHFYPLTASFTFEPRGFTDPEFREWGFWLDRDLLEVSSISIDDVAETTFTLQPARFGPPYEQILIRSGTEYVIAGEWGYTDDTEPAGAIAEDLDTSETGVDVTDASLIGIGDLIRVGTERMIVTGRTLLDTTANIAGDVAASAASNVIAVNTGSLVKTNEVITIDAERMRVTDVVGNNLIVRRAVDGSTLAAHTSGADVYSPRTLTVVRGATGSTAAAHSTSAAIVRHVAPGPIRDLCLAEALTALEQERSAYGRVIGSGEGQREAAGRGIEDVRAKADLYRRRRWATL